MPLLILKLIILFGSMVLLAKTIDLQVLITQFSMDMVGWLVLATGLSYISYTLQGLRLALLMGDSTLFKPCFKGTFVGLAINNIVPLRAGEIGKIIYISDQSNKPAFTVAGTVVVERLMDATILLLLGCIMLNGSNFHQTLLMLGVVIALIWGGLFLLYKHPHLLTLFEKITIFKQILDSVTAIWHPKRGVTAAIFTLLTWIVNGIWVTIIFRFCSGILLDLHQYLVLFVASAVIMALPVIPGAIGVFEAGMLVALSWYGVDEHTALAGAILVHAVQLIPTSLTGIGVLIFSGYNFSFIKTCYERVRRSNTVN